MEQEMTVTANMLEVNEACAGQVKKFLELFPNGSSVSFEDCLIAVKSGLNLNWFASVFLTNEAFDYFRLKVKSDYDTYIKARTTFYCDYLKQYDLYHSDFMSKFYIVSNDVLFNDNLIRDFKTKFKDLHDEYIKKCKPFEDCYNEKLAEFVAEAWKLGNIVENPLLTNVRECDTISSS